MKIHQRRRWWLLAALFVVGAAAAGWAILDLFGPQRSDLREFDADAVARMETDMWRSYYDRHELRLFFQLAELLRTQYRMPFLRSNLTAFYGARSAFIF